MEIPQERPASTVFGLLMPVRLSDPLQSDDHIRLLLLEPSVVALESDIGFVVQVQPDVVRFKVYQALLRDLEPDEVPLFAALSYRWGDPSRTHTVYLGLEPIRVHANLHEALVHCRFRNQSRLIWTDSICINQDDDEEKSKQVARMGDVYRIAHAVVWLGLSHDPIADAEMIRRLPELDPASPARELAKANRASNWRNLPALQPIEIAATRRGYGHLIGFPWASILRLNNNPYFKRLWIVQEMICSKSHEFQFAWWRIPLRYMQNVTDLGFALTNDLNATARAQDTDLDIVEGYAGSVLDRSSTRDYEHTAQPGEIVAEFSNRQCSDLRDYVYGMVALFALRAPMQQYHVDYSLTVQDVYMNFAMHCLRTLNDTALWSVGHRKLCYNDTDSGAKFTDRAWTPDLPSWCPDWAGPDRGVRQLVLHAQVDVGETFWRACGHTKPEWLRTPRPVLGLRGMSMCKVVECTPSFNTASEIVHDGLISLEQLAMKLTTSQSTHTICLAYIDLFFDRGSLFSFEDLREVFSDIADGVEYNELRSRLGAVWLQTYAKRLYATSGFARRPVGRRSRKRAIAYKLLEWSIDAEWSMHAALHIRFFTTSNGMLGSGVEGLKPGDEICVLFGALVPFVLRPHPDGVHHLLIGEAHVPGLMYGEAFEMGVPTRNFLLL